MRSLPVALGIVALAGMIGLAACGSDNDHVGETAPATAGAASSAAPNTAAVPSTTATAASTPPAGSGATNGGTMTLENVTWTLSDATQLGVELADVDVTARFVGGTVAGTSGCNRYSGQYTVQGDSLTINPAIAGTMMACAQAQMAVETAYLKALPTVATYAIDGSTLTLSDASGKAILVYGEVTGEQAVAGSWQVTGVRTATAISSPVPGSTLTLDLASGTASGNAGCNTFTGGYTVTGEDLTFGALATTRKACTDPALTQQESDYLAALGATKTFSSTSKMLTLLAEDGTITVTLARA